MTLPRWILAAVVSAALAQPTNPPRAQAPEEELLHCQRCDCCREHCPMKGAR